MDCAPAPLVHTEEVALAESMGSAVQSGSDEPGTRSSAGEHALHTGGVVGSIPTASTIIRLGQAPYWGYQPPLNWDRWDEPMWLYVIAQKRSRRPVKIGISRNIEQRILSLEAGNPRGLVLLHKRQARRAIAPQIERRLHQHFAAHCIGREWFTIGVKDVREPMAVLADAARLALKQLRADSKRKDYPATIYHVRRDSRWAA